MEEIIKTIQLEYEKSTFLVDIVKHNKGQLYVAVEQIIQIDKNRKSSDRIKINPTILGDLIETLTVYKKEIDSKLPSTKKGYFSDDKQAEIINRYLKGVEIKDLCIQFNSTEEIIKQVLNNKGIKIVSNKVPTKKWWRYRKQIST